MKNSVQEQRAELVRLDKQQDELYHRCAVHLGISDTAFWVMYFLCDFEEVYTQNALAELWCLPKQTVNSAINNLVKKGYVSRVRSAQDKRVVLLSLTDKGLSAYEKHAAFHQKMVSTVMEGLDGQEMEVLAHALEKLRGYFKVL